jgi:hypothetical protein
MPWISSGDGGGAAFCWQAAARSPPVAAAIPAMIRRIAPTDLPRRFDVARRPPDYTG